MGEITRDTHTTELTRCVLGPSFHFLPCLSSSYSLSELGVSCELPSLSLTVCPVTPLQPCPRQCQLTLARALASPEWSGPDVSCSLTSLLH